MTPAAMAKRIEQLLVFQGWTQAECAKHLGVSVRTIQRRLVDYPPMTTCETCGRRYRFVRAGSVMCLPCRAKHGKDRGRARRRMAAMSS